MTYSDVYAAAKADPNAFWMEAAEAIDWVEKPSKALFDDRARRFTSGLSTVRSTHAGMPWTATSAAGHGDRVAIIHDSPVTHTKHEITYTELQERVSMLAGAIQAQKGRRERRSGPDLHADDTGGGGSHARMCPPWCRAFCRLWRICLERASGPGRRRATQGHHRRVLRDRARPGRTLQAAAGRGTGNCQTTIPNLS